MRKVTDKEIRQALDNHKAMTEILLNEYQNEVNDYLMLQRMYNRQFNN